MSQQAKHTPGPIQSLCRLALQTESYQQDLDFAEAVVRVLNDPVWDAAPNMLEALERIAHIPCERTGNIHCSMLPKESNVKTCPFCAVREATAKAKGE